MHSSCLIYYLINLRPREAKRGQERPATLILTVISGFPIMRARHVYNRDLETRNSNFALQLRTIRMRKKVSIITVCHMASKLLSHGSEDVFLLTLLRRAWRTLNVLTLLRRATRTSRTSGLLRVIFYVVSPCPAAGQGFQNAPCPAVRILLMSS